MKKLILLIALVVGMATNAMANDHHGRLIGNVGLLYETGMDATLAYEYETGYHNAWEFFTNGYVKWNECASCGHVCPESFWHNYRTWDLGVAYKPCVMRLKNSHGNTRMGGFLGSDTHHVIGGFTLGYEHSYNIYHGWEVFWQVKSDLVIGGEDLFRTGVEIGIKLPL